MMNAKEAIERYGGFHDAKILALKINPPQKKIVIHLDDVNANSRGLNDLPEGGADPAIVTLSYETLDMSVDSVSPVMRFYDCKVGDPVDDDLTIMISPSGLIKIGGCKFELTLTASDS